LIKVFGPKREVAYTFLSNEPNEVIEKSKGRDRVKALCVMLLPENSNMVFYKGSHLHDLQARDADTGLLQVTEKSLQREHINPCEVKLRGGGL
jgi:hypothetical protein